MNDLRKAAEQAVEAIMHGGVKEQAAAVYELRQALAESKREWVGLTDEEIENLWEMAQAWNAPKHFYILISAKLKEKNSG
jgi:hypothetical protein